MKKKMWLALTLLAAIFGLSFLSACGSVGTVDMTTSPAPVLQAQATSETARYPAPGLELPSDIMAPKVNIQYQPQAGSPRYMTAFTHANLGCSWVGVAGQVFDLDGAPVTGVMVVIRGRVGSVPFEYSGITTPKNAYGPGGYEVFLFDQPAAPGTQLEIQLVDLQRIPVSEPATFYAPSSCQENLVLMNFQAAYAQPQYHLYLPVLFSADQSFSPTQQPGVPYP